jgi:hypothetical protein
MWFFREIFRLIWMIAVATAIAAAIGGLLALAKGGAFTHSLRIAFLLIGCLLLILSTAGNRGTASARRTNWGIMTGFSTGLGRLSPPVRSRPGEPTLTATAVFFGSAIVLIALGVIV